MTSKLQALPTPLTRKDCSFVTHPDALEQNRIRVYDTTVGRCADLSKRLIVVAAGATCLFIARRILFNVSDAAGFAESLTVHTLAALPASFFGLNGSLRLDHNRRASFRFNAFYGASLLTTGGVVIATRPFPALLVGVCHVATGSFLLTRARVSKQTIVACFEKASHKISSLKYSVTNRINQAVEAVVFLFSALMGYNR